MNSSAILLEPAPPQAARPAVAVTALPTGGLRPTEPAYRSRHAYKNHVLPAIAHARPFTCDPSRPFEVHVLSCERDYLTSLWALKTLALALGYLPPVVVHDDGSLSDAACACLSEQLRGARVLRDEAVAADRRFRATLDAYPLTRYWRFEVDSPFARKVIDAAYYAEREFIVLLDSDILFFRPPPTMVACLEDLTPFMSTDYQSAYCPPLQELRNNGTTIDENINTGLGGMPRRYFDLAWAETFFSIHTHRNWFPWTDVWLEQAIVAGMFTCCPGRRMLPRTEHDLSFYYLTEQSCSHHYVGDGSRELYFSVGLRQVERLGLLARLGLKPAAPADA